MNELFREHENSLRRFLVNELIKQFKNDEVKRDPVERTRLVIDPSAIADVQLARHFSKNHANSI
jgi:hypothetical protein